MRDFIDFRWVGDNLQFRTRIPVADASGAICGFGEWREWRFVGGEAPTELMPKPEWPVMHDDGTVGTE